MGALGSTNSTTSIATTADLASNTTLNVIDAAGDLLVGTADNTVGRLAKGSDGQVLTVDPTTHLLVWATPSAGSGSVATDTIWDAAGDLVQGTGANTAAKLSAGTAGMFLKSAGAAAANLWAFPPGYEFDYVQITSNASITATTEAGATTVVTGNAVTYDGSTIVMVEFFAPLVTPGTGAVWIRFQLFDGSSSIADTFGYWQPDATPEYVAIRLARRLTPSAAAHTYSVRAYQANSNAGTVFAGAGGAGNVVPAFIRITKV